VAFEGAAVSSPTAWLKILRAGVFEAEEEDHMKRLRLAIFGLVSMLALGFTPLSAQADNSPLSNASVSFGAWMTVPALDRFPDVSPREANHHELIPRQIRIKAGGTVNFIIAGFHQVIVYDDGTQPGEIDTAVTVPPTEGGPPLINDPNNRIYRGLDPSLQPRDRVEVVHFPNPGTYLVICGVLPHFVDDDMFGFVKVLPADKKD
jgi:hypothetical protein